MLTYFGSKIELCALLADPESGTFIEASFTRDRLLRSIHSYKGNTRCELRTSGIGPTC